MGEVVELDYDVPNTPPVSAPPSQIPSPSMTRSPLLRPATPRTPRFSMTPLASPMRKAMTNMRGYLEEVGHMTKLDPQDAWLPITESRNGNAYYSAFHTLSSGIGFQALVLWFVVLEAAYSFNMQRKSQSMCTSFDFQILE